MLKRHIGLTFHQISTAQITSESLNGLPNIGPMASGRVVDLAVKMILYILCGHCYWRMENFQQWYHYVSIFENEKTHSVGALAVNHKHPHIMWVGTGDRANRQSSGWGDGMYKSHDGGDTWQHVGLKDSHHIGRIALHPNDSNTVYVAAMGHLWGPNNERGLYKTTDGGDTWERIIYIDDDTGG